MTIALFLPKSCVFFLATKDETSGILKNFIRQIENQLNHKVKIIRSDNGTEFKNRDMLEFCGKTRNKKENQTNPHAGISEVTNSACTLQTPNANASKEEDEAEELIIVLTAVRKVGPRKSSTNSKAEDKVQQHSGAHALEEPKKISKALKDDSWVEAMQEELESSFDLEAFLDSDYAGANLDRKSTTDGCQFLGSRLISWQCKKQTIVATSWQYKLLWISINPVYHSKTKHIEIRHHFIRDSYEKKLIRVEKIHTDFNVADLLTKAFDGPSFVVYFVCGLTFSGYTWLALEHGLKLNWSCAKVNSGIVNINSGSLLVNP
ncbi:putative ribonuclease H-like domain-containing protein, partial [Tanacetum coccineum]